MSESAPVYIEVQAGVRYWDDAAVDGQSDAQGNLIPFRAEGNWCPVIRLADGAVMDWPQGTKANVHYKVCDDGEYWLLDETRQRIGKWAGFYVPGGFLCHGSEGYGDYIILNIGKDGVVQSWREPKVTWTCDCAEDEEADDSGWKKLPKPEVKQHE